MKRIIATGAVTLCALAAASTASAFPKSNAEVNGIITACNTARTAGDTRTPDLPDIYTTDAGVSAGQESGLKVLRAKVNALKTGAHPVAPKTNWQWVDLTGGYRTAWFTRVDAQSPWVKTTVNVTPSADAKVLAELNLVIAEIDAAHSTSTVTKKIKAKAWNLLVLRALLALDHDSVEVNFASMNRPSVVLVELLQRWYRTEILSKADSAQVSQASFATKLAEALPDVMPTWSTVPNWDTIDPSGAIAIAREQDWARFIVPFRKLVLNETNGPCGVAALGGSLSLYSLNKAVVSRAYPFGVSFEPVGADGVLFGPLQFFVHDVTHSSTTETDFHVPGPGLETVLYPAIRPAKCLAFLEQFPPVALSEDKETSLNNFRVQLIMFFLLHENPPPITNFRDLAKWLTTNDTIGRFIDKNDFGGTLERFLDEEEEETLEGMAHWYIDEALVYTLKQLVRFQLKPKVEWASQTVPERKARTEWCLPTSG